MVGEMNGEGTVRLSDLAAGPVRRRLTPDADARAALAVRVGLEALPRLVADMEVRPWMDGCQVHGRFEGEVIQVCGVSLEAFSQPVSGEVDLRFAPEGSPNLPEEPANGGEIEVSLDTPDPPERLDGETVDLMAILVEHLSLVLDPFPRRPDAVFDWSAPTEETSPFAALRALRKSAE